MRDAIGALSELGVDIEELSDYCSIEGKELSRYALYSARRVEDLHEFQCMLLAAFLAICLMCFSTTVRGTAPGPR